MSFKMPSVDQMRKLGESLGLELTADYANSVIDFIRPFAEGYRLLAALPDDVPPVKYLRGPYYRPDGDENKYGAWSVNASAYAIPAPSYQIPSQVAAYTATVAACI